MIIQTAPKINLLPNVAVVFSSPALLNEKNGVLIDSHDEVIRFNDFRIKGFEEFGGTKTTLHVTTGVAENRINSESYRLTRRVQKIDASKRPSKRRAVFDSKIIETAKKLTGRFASSGFRTIVCLINSGIKPNLFGFEREFSDIYAYYWDVKTTYKHAHHNFRKEKEAILKYESEGKLKIID